MRKYVITLLCIIPCLTFGQTKYQKDFDELLKIVHGNYAYLQQQRIDWQKVQAAYEPTVDTIRTHNQFIVFLEKVLNELHNGHVSLNTNLSTSNRLVPSGADMYVEKLGNKYFVTDLRKNFGAEQCGIKMGMEVIRFNDKAIDEQLKHFLPTYTHEHNPRMVQFATDMLFAGTHDKPRKITVLDNGIQNDFYPDKLQVRVEKQILDYKILGNGVGYIRINNSLYDNDLIQVFDEVIDSFITLKSIIIDLTETPSGGNSTVARAMMGRFVRRMLPYQQHEIDETRYVTKRYWVEYVLPRKTTYNGKVIIMVGHWTGSMGEGIAIGFDGMKRATIVGTRMAGLLGAIDGFTLPETKIGFQIPTERLYHINGQPREDYKPAVRAKNIADTWQQVNKMLQLP